MSRLIFYVTALLLIVMTISVNGQRTVTGRLIDKETGKPVKDASITQIGTDIETTSNALGFFQLQVDSPVSIEINSSDYPTMQVKLPEANNFKIEMSKAQVIDKAVDEIFAPIDEAASFPGGFPKFYDYISKNLKYPKAAKKSGITGKVLVEFLINRDGTIDSASVRVVPVEEVEMFSDLTKTEIVNHEECNIEAIRLIKGSPKWNPALQRDKPVRQRMVVPIRFR